MIANKSKSRPKHKMSVKQGGSQKSPAQNDTMSSRGSSLSTKPLAQSHRNAR